LHTGADPIIVVQAAPANLAWVNSLRNGGQDIGQGAPSSAQFPIGSSGETHLRSQWSRAARWRRAKFSQREQTSPNWNTRCFAPLHC